MTNKEIFPIDGKAIFHYIETEQFDFLALLVYIHRRFR